MQPRDEDDAAAVVLADRIDGVLHPLPPELDHPAVEVQRVRVEVPCTTIRIPIPSGDGNGELATMVTATGHGRWEKSTTCRAQHPAHNRPYISTSDRHHIGHRSTTHRYQLDPGPSLGSL